MADIVQIQIVTDIADIVHIQMWQIQNRYMMAMNDQFHKGIPNPGNRTEQTLSPHDKASGMGNRVQTDISSIRNLQYRAANIYHIILRVTNRYQESNNHSVNSI